MIHSYVWTLPWPLRHIFLLRMAASSESTAWCVLISGTPLVLVGMGGEREPLPAFWLKCIVHPKVKNRLLTLSFQSCLIFISSVELKILLLFFIHTMKLNVLDPIDLTTVHYMGKNILQKWSFVFQGRHEFGMTWGRKKYNFHFWGKLSLRIILHTLRRL